MEHVEVETAVEIDSILSRNPALQSGQKLTISLTRILDLQIKQRFTIKPPERSYFQIKFAAKAIHVLKRPFKVIITCLDGPLLRNSHRQIPCHMPNTKLPLAIGMLR